MTANQDICRVPGGTIVLKEVSRVPGIPCHVVISGNVRKEGGQLVDSAMQGSYITFGGNKPRYRLSEKQGFMTLAERIATKENWRAAYTNFTRRRWRLSSERWHDVLGHIDPAAKKNDSRREDLTK